MRAHRTCCIAIATLGLLAAAIGLSASIVPTLVPSLALATIFAILAVAILCTVAWVWRQSKEVPQENPDHTENEPNGLKEQLSALRQLHAQLLEDKTFLQFLKADQDHEKQLLALDLHDLTLPNLTSALFHLEAIGQRNTLDGESIETTVGLIRESLHQTRRVMNCLSPTLVQDEGVVASLQRLADQLEASVETVRFRHDVDFDRLTPLCECALVQLVREIFDQIRRHREAKTVVLELLQNQEHLELRISDDGHRRDSFPSEDGRGRVQECLEILSGHLETEMQPQSGMVVRVEFSATDLIQSDTMSEKSRAYS